MTAVAAVNLPSDRSNRPYVSLCLSEKPETKLGMWSTLWREAEALINTELRTTPMNMGR